jgi:hypothetical protein
LDTNTQIECDDTSKNETENVKLLLQNDIIINGQIIRYHTSQNEANNASKPIGGQDTNTSNPEIIFARLQGDTKIFCFDITSFEISTEACEIIIPPAFSPNIDGINDAFEIRKLLALYEAFELQIFNRYGELIFKGGNEEGYWNEFPNNGL